MATAFALVVTAVFFRLISPALLIWNFVPMGAVSLYAGARLPRRWAWLVPVASMALSDVVLYYLSPWPVPPLTRATIYLTFAATTLLGPLANRPKVGRWLLPFLAAGSSMLFFVTSNLATWGEGLLYPLTLGGLAECFELALPFYRNTFAADLLGTAVLFGLCPVIERAFQPAARPQLVKVKVESEIGAADPHRAG